MACVVWLGESAANNTTEQSVGVCVCMYCMQVSTHTRETLWEYVRNKYLTHVKWKYVHMQEVHTVQEWSTVSLPDASSDGGVPQVVFYHSCRMIQAASSPQGQAMVVGS